jgi:hypothetical protein
MPKMKHVGKLGGSLRPITYSDKDESKKRGGIYVGGMLVLVLMLALIATYHNANASFKRKKKVNPQKEDLDKLYLELDADPPGIFSLRCPCKSRVVANHPRLVDIEGGPCPGDPEPAEGEQNWNTTFDTPLYSRCLGAFDASNDARDCATHSYSASYHEGMCFAFVQGVRKKWPLHKQKIAEMQNPMHYKEDVLEDYYDLCVTSLADQSSFVEMLYESMTALGLGYAARAQYNDEAPILTDAIIKRICLEEGHADYELFYATEESHILEQYMYLFGSCKPTRCEWEVEESGFDVLLKTSVRQPSALALPSCLLRSTAVRYSRGADCVWCASRRWCRR